MIMMKVIVFLWKIEHCQTDILSDSNQAQSFLKPWDFDSNYSITINFETSSFDIRRVGRDPLTLPAPVKTALLILSALIG